VSSGEIHSDVRNAVKKASKASLSQTLNVEMQVAALNEPTNHESVGYRAFRLQRTTEGIIKIFAE
jgi:hypothetical protein